MAVGAHIEAGGEPKPRGRLDEDFVPHEKVADRLRRIVDGFLRKEPTAAFDKPALGDRLSLGRDRYQDEQQKEAGCHGRRIASSVKSSSLSGTL